ncbi:MAG: hypothetical protein AAFX05_11540 [Planctomycetota bacterium]
MSSTHVDMERVLAADNVELTPGSGSLLWRGMLGLGLIMTGVTAVSTMVGEAESRSIALHALHTGFVSAIGFPLAAMVFVMILHQTNAGWSATIRRQFEHMMSLVWIAVPMFFGILVLQMVANMGSEPTKYSPFIWNWMNPAYTEGDVLYEIKAPYLNVPFFLVRAIIYFAVWLGLSLALYNFSMRMDADGDRWNIAKARKLSAIGLPLAAFTMAFAGFDWVMTLDFHWFSTMLGVHFFAGSMVLAIALGTLTMIALRSSGRLHHCFTQEHLHDLSKLVFAFTVFWAYISFSQYFLIWYANIPEETWFFQIRKTGDWEWMSWMLPIAHFIVPFLFLLPRPVRRSPGLMALACVYMIVVHLTEVFWMVRPEVSYGEAGPGYWQDFVGVLGPVLIFLGLYVRKVTSGPLIPLRDPRLPEALTHRNNI